MTETLLSASNVLLFGRVVEDLKVEKPIRPIATANSKVRLASKSKNYALAGLTPPVHVDGVVAKVGNRILLKDQTNADENGIYVLVEDPADPTKVAFDRAKDLDEDSELRQGMIIWVRKGTQASTNWELTTENPSIGDDLMFAALTATSDGRHGPFSEDRAGSIGELEEQLAAEDKDKVRTAKIARIYGFSYEGSYYELPRAALFLVHGDGADAAEVRIGKPGQVRRARAPGEPSLTGLSAVDFQFSEDIRVWSYDKADYTIRMDVESGMFEDVLLAPFFGGDGYGVSGAKVSGAKVSGAKLSGSRIAGAKISGAKLSGGRGDASD